MKKVGEQWKSELAKNCGKRKTYEASTSTSTLFPNSTRFSRNISRSVFPTTRFVQFLDAKFMTFSRVLSKHSFFSRLKVIETLKNTGTKFFSWWVANVRVRLNEIRPKQKTFTHKGTCCGLKKEKKTKTFYHFLDFAFIFQTVSRSGKLLSKFQDFFKNSRLCTNPATISGPGKGYRHWDSSGHIIMHFRDTAHLPLKPTFCPKWEVSVNVGLGEG